MDKFAVLKDPLKTFGDLDYPAYTRCWKRCVPSTMSVAVWFTHRKPQTQIALTLLNRSQRTWTMLSSISVNVICWLEQHGPNMPMLDPNVPLDRAGNGAEEAQSMNGDAVPDEPQPAAAPAAQYALPQIFRLRKMMMRGVPGIDQALFNNM